MVTGGQDVVKVNVQLILGGAAQQLGHRQNHPANASEKGGRGSGHRHTSELEPDSASVL